MNVLLLRLARCGIKTPPRYLDPCTGLLMFEPVFLPVLKDTIDMLAVGIHPKIPKRTRNPPQIIHMLELEKEIAVWFEEQLRLVWPKKYKKQKRMRNETIPRGLSDIPTIAAPTFDPDTTSEDDSNADNSDAGKPRSRNVSINSVCSGEENSLRRGSNPPPHRHGGPVVVGWVYRDETTTMTTRLMPWHTIQPTHTGRK
eukprot:gene1885-12892_t